MTWVKTHDGEWLEEWVEQVGNEAYGAYKRLEGYCGQVLTDGRVPRHILAMVFGGASGKKALLALEIVGRVQRNELGDAVLPFFLDNNPSKATVEAGREQRSAAGRKGGLRSRRSPV